MTRRMPLSLVPIKAESSGFIPIMPCRRGYFMKLTLTHASPTPITITYKPATSAELRQLRQNEPHFFALSLERMLKAKDQ